MRPIFFYVLKSASGGEGQNKREIILSRLHAQHRAQCEAPSQDPGIMTWAEITSPTLNWVSHPGAPVYLSILFFWSNHIWYFVLFCFFNAYLFILRKVGRSRERERERILSRLGDVSTDTDAGLEPTTEIMAWAEVKNWILDRLSHPGAPIRHCVFTFDC